MESDPFVYFGKMLIFVIFDKKNMKNYIVLLLFFVCATVAKSQSATDTIFKKNGEVMLVKITEVGIDEIKYKPLYNPNDIILAIEKSLVLKIIFSNGIVQIIEDPQNSPSSYADNRKNAIKFNYLSPLSSRAHLNFEHSIHPGFSYVVGLNLIGLGLPEGRETPVGATINGGVRLYRLPDMKSRSDRYSHLMNGSYFEPSFVFGLTQHGYTSYQFDDVNYQRYNLKNETAINGYFAFFLNLGKQFVFANRICLDMNFGIGYGTYSGQKKSYSENRVNSANNVFYNDPGKYVYEYTEPSRFGFTIGSNGFPLAGNIQLKIGYLFN